MLTIQMFWSGVFLAVSVMCKTLKVGVHVSSVLNFFIF